MVTVTGDCHFMVRKSDIGVMVVCSLMLITMIPILCKFIKQRKSIGGPLKLSYYPGLAFIIFNMLALADVLATTIMNCTALEHWYFFYISQSYLLILQSFIRLNHVFNQAFLMNLALSSKIIKVFKFMFIVIPIYTVIAIVMTILFTSIAVYNIIIFAPILLTLIILMISTIYIFIKKLISVYKHVDQEPTLISAITRLSILHVSSISITLLVLFIDVGFPIILPDFGGSILDVTEKYIGCLDVYTNFWCLILSYNIFNGLYQKLCGSLDSKCRILWTKVVDKRPPMTSDESMIRHEISIATITPGSTTNQTNSQQNIPELTGASSNESETVSSQNNCKIPVTQLQTVQSASSDGPSANTPNIV